MPPKGHWLVQVLQFMSREEGGAFRQDGSSKACCSPCAVSEMSTLEPSATRHRFLIYVFPRLLLARTPTPLLILTFISCFFMSDLCFV